MWLSWLYHETYFDNDFHGEHAGKYIIEVVQYLKYSKINN